MLLPPSRQSRVGTKKAGKQLRRACWRRAFLSKAWGPGANQPQSDLGSDCRHRGVFRARSDSPVRRRKLSEVTVLSAARPRGVMSLRGRSYVAFALTPSPPIADWLTELDAWLRGSTGFFNGRPVVLDLAAVTLTSSAIAHLVSEL